MSYYFSRLSTVAETRTVKFLASLLSYDTLDKNGELKEPDPAAFSAAMAAIERAAAERASMMIDRRMGGDDRRKGSPDTRSDGAPERRRGFERRAAPSQKFGKRGS